MLRKAALCAVALMGTSLAEAAKLQKRDGDHGHGGGGHSAPSSSYGAPSDSYGAPSSSYGAPAASYSAPAPSYGAPAPSYEEPAPSYGAPSTGYGQVSYEEEEGFPDLTFIIVGILIVTGLSLLFPTYISVSASGRKKRDIEEDVNPLVDVVERVNDIYSSVIQSEECLERIACEIGGLASDVGLKTATKLADPFVPTKYKAYYRQFQDGKDCRKIKCGSLAF
jgi:hypothetical protein